MMKSAWCKAYKGIKCNSSIDGDYFALSPDRYFHKSAVSCYEFKLHNDFAESLVKRGLSPLPICVLDSEQLIFTY